MDGHIEAIYPSKRKYSNAAPLFAIPSRTIISVEHPGIIKNIDRAIQTLGGTLRVSNLVEEDGRTKAAAELRIRPEDRGCRPLSASNIQTSNVLARITIPKRTGRKRKRGSKEPYIDALSDTVETSNGADLLGLTSGGVSYLLESMHATVGRYSFEAVGIIEQTHRFRSVPDFVWSTTNSPFMKKVREHILPFDVEKMKGFTFDMSKGVKPNIELIPPPTFTHFPISFNYGYHQNPNVKQQTDELGNIFTQNMQPARKILTQVIPWDAEVVPAAPPYDLPPLATLDTHLQKAASKLAKLLEERPILTRRVIANRLGDPGWYNNGKYVHQYFGYMFRSGPWRDAVIRFGVDPRKDSECRFYQTLSFQFMTKLSEEHRVSREAMRDKMTQSHIFSGKTASQDGKVWQVCDITNPLLKSILSVNDLRSECESEYDGWYQNGTWAKTKVIMKAMLMRIWHGEGAPQDQDYLKIALLPDLISDETRHLTVLSKNEATARELRWASEVRAAAKTSSERKERRLRHDIPTAVTDNEHQHDAEMEDQPEATDSQEQVFARNDRAAQKLKRIEEEEAREEEGEEEEEGDGGEDGEEDGEEDEEDEEAEGHVESMFHDEIRDRESIDRLREGLETLGEEYDESDRDGDRYAHELSL